MEVWFSAINGLLKSEITFSDFYCALKFNKSFKVLSDEFSLTDKKELEDLIRDV